MTCELAGPAFKSITTFPPWLSLPMIATDSDLVIKYHRVETILTAVTYHTNLEPFLHRPTLRKSLAIDSSRDTFRGTWTPPAGLFWKEVSFSQTRYCGGNRTIPCICEDSNDQSERHPRQH